MAEWSLREVRYARLVARASRGDRRAFGALYDALQPVIWAYVSRRVSTQADAEDLVSRVFQRMLENLDRYDAKKAGVRTWAFAIARNQVIDHLRTRRAVVGLHEAGEDVHLTAVAPSDPVGRLDDQRRVARLQALVEDYPPQVREMLALRFGDGLRYREIGELLGLSEDAVKQRFSRTVRELERRLADPPNNRKAEGYAT